MAFAYETIAQGNGKHVSFSICRDISQLSTDVDVVVSGSELDCRGCRNASYTFSSVTNNVTATIFAANKSDFSDEVAFSSAVGSVVVGTPKSWVGQATGTAPANCVFAFLRVKIKASSGGSQGTITINGYAN